jgi:hypothetical protein
MNMPVPTLRQRLGGLPLAIALSLGLCLVTASQILVVFAQVAPSWSELSLAVGLDVWNSPLRGDVAYFVMAQLLVHAALALPVWLLALATERAWPELQGRRNTLVAAWFGLVLVWILLANATLYPWSASGVHSWLLLQPIIGSARAFELLTAALLGLCGWVCLKVALAFPRMRRALPRTLAYASLAAFALLTVQLVRAANPRTALQGDRPNVIIVGIDSLRPDAVGEYRGIGLTPNVDRFLRDGAHQFTDAVTPAARTFPSWISILTGHNPRANGAREDLMPRASLASLPTLAHLLKARGYQTTFAMDEVRFSNIDESYGFDKVISPTMGVADFVLGKANDLPLPNLLANTRLGRWLFPATYGNRGAAHVYEPRTFVEWIDAELESNGPQFVAVHLTLSHYPFFWAGGGFELFDHRGDRAYEYAASVVAADRQFGELMQVFETRGLLANAIVVVLSDHGEAFGKPASDTLLRAAEARGVLGPSQRIRMMGHGASVLSPHQYNVVLALRGYGKSEFGSSARTQSAPASLIDVAPTLLDFLGPGESPGFEGLSLLGVIAGAADAEAQLAKRVRFTETGFRTPLLNTADIDETALLKSAAPFFRMNPKNARFEVRDEMLPRLIADKERAAMSANLLLASIPPSPDAKYHKYVLVERKGGGGRRITSAPDAQTDPEARRLWDALHAQYGSELLPPES